MGQYRLVDLYHTSPEARNQTRQKILAEQLNVELVDAETTSLEISAQGTDEGNGLEKLCQYLNIPLSQTIVVGDADNDIAAMKKAGLAVAMKNANKYHCILKKKMDHIKLKINCMTYTVSAVRPGRLEV